MVVLLMLMLVLLMAEVLLWVGGAMPWWEAMWCERASDTIGMRRRPRRRSVLTAMHSRNDDHL